MSQDELGRIEAFSDAVIAVAATLLVLELKVPDRDAIHSTAELGRALLHMWPSYFAFVYTFGLIFVGWVNHHDAFKWIARPSRSFVYANGFLLMMFMFMPFPTALLAGYLGTEYSQPAIVVFCAFNLLPNAGWIVFFETMLRSPGVLNPEAATHARNSRRAGYFGALIYLSTTMLAVWFPTVALLINSSLWILWIAVSLKVGAAHAGNQEPLSDALIPAPAFSGSRLT